MPTRSSPKTPPWVLSWKRSPPRSITWSPPAARPTSYKSEITEDELGEALKASIAAKATKADLDALTVRVGDIEKAGYQTAEQVQAAIAASGHAHFEVAETDPTAEGFEAQANVMYLYMNSKTKHYDIYAKVGESVVLLDDTPSI